MLDSLARAEADPDYVLDLTSLQEQGYYKDDGQIETEVLIHTWNTSLVGRHIICWI